MKYFFSFLLLFLILVIFTPIAVFAQGGIVPDCGPDCGFNDLITLIQRVINFIIIVASPIAALLFAWAGWLYMSASGDQNQISKAQMPYLKQGFLCLDK